MARGRETEEPDHLPKKRERRDPASLGWWYRTAAVLVSLLVALLWAGASLCGIAENRSELFMARCESGYYNIALLGFLVLLGGLGAGELVHKRWPAWVGIALTPVPGLVSWQLLSV